MNDVIELLTAHRSIREFTEQPIAQSIIEVLILAGQSASTSSFLQACTVIQVTDPVNRRRIARLAGDQDFVEKAAVFLVFCADMKRHKIACEIHNADMRSGYAEQFITATVDCALFAQNVVTGAESLGLGAVYIGALRNHIAEVTEILRVPKLVYPVFGLCLGHPAQKPEKKPRLPLSVVLKQNCYDDSRDSETIATYDHEVNRYYRTRTENIKSMDWSDQIADMLVKERRPHMLNYLQGQGFLLR